MPVFGTDYDTPDGTCIRDYIHVIDIARAHILALDCFRENTVSKVYNLGSGRGYSVLEVIKTARRVTGVLIPVNVYPRRVGDPVKIVTSYDLVGVDMG